jgi:hypothetical protein
MRRLRIAAPHDPRSARSPSRPVGHRRACASLAASFAAGRSQAGARTDDRSTHRHAHRHLPSRCAGAFADARRIVAGDEGGRVRTRSDHPVPGPCGVGDCHNRTDSSSPTSVAPRSPMGGASLPTSERVPGRVVRRGRALCRTLARSAAHRRRWCCALLLPDDRVVSAVTANLSR